jgi:hypothetical protein
MAVRAMATQQFLLAILLPSMLNLVRGLSHRNLKVTDDGEG